MTAQARATFADADGVRIRYTDHGGDAHPLVLVHATGFHRRIWDPYLPSLTSRFRVVTLDQRGHGDSDKPASGYEWQNLGRDVLAVVGHLGLDEPYGAGHSAGGAALVLAEANRRGTFGKLALLDPVLPDQQFRGAMQQNAMADSARRRRGVWDSAQQMIDRLRAGSPLAEWRDDFLRAYVEHGTRPLPDGRVELKCPPQVEAQVYEGSTGHDGWERLPDITTSVLVLLGESSHLWPPGRRKLVAERVRGGRVDVVPGCGHFFPMQDPDATLTHILAFLEE